MSERIKWIERWLDDNTPPGFPWRTTLKGVGCAGLLSFLWSLTFVIVYINSYNNLFTVYVGKRMLRQGAVMVDFAYILSGRLIGFFAIAAAMAAMVIYHYSYYFHGSKSIYLMKRLPKKGQLWRRCVILPAVIAAFSLAAAFILTLIYFSVYMTATPASCLSPDQWAKLWDIGNTW